MKRLAWLLLLCSTFALAQRDNTFYVLQFPGSTVGTKATAAQKACSKNTNIPCVLIFDPSLAVYPQGTMPTKCAQCVWMDYAGKNGGISIGVSALSKLNDIVLIDGAKYQRTDAGIQAAINDVAEGGTIWLSSGTYNLCNNLPIVISKSVRLTGAGDSSKLNLCSTVSSTTDTIVIRPTSTYLFNVELSRFMVTRDIATAGRHDIHIDGTTGGINQALVSRVRLGKGTDYAIYADGTASGNGTPRITTIEESILGGGIYAQALGDTVKIVHNQIDGSTAALDVTFQGGASTLKFEDNNLTALGGVHIGGSAVATHIVNNEFETVTGFTGSNGAVLDIDGSASAGADTVFVRGNSFQNVNGAGIDNVRVNYCTGCYIEGNRFYRASGAKDIRITANANLTAIGKNFWVSGAPIADMVADSGVGSIWGFAFNDEFVLRNNTSMTQMDETGVQRGIFRTNSDGVVYYYGYHGTPMMSGMDGMTYLYDGAGKQGATVGVSPSSSVQEGTFVSGSAFAGKGRTVASLGSAADSPGVWAHVSDSTAVATEGQTCVGGGTAHALAFSNGSAWKCF